MAERIGNLLGHLQFSDDQLQRTQKGLKDSGVAMPNFGNIGRELAKEINEEPEVEIETEDERKSMLYHIADLQTPINLQAATVSFWKTKAPSSRCNLIYEVF